MVKDYSEFQKAERLDDLQVGGFKLYQNADFFCFGLDAVLLSEFAKVRPAERVIDLCSGTGAIPFLMLAKKKLQFATALELVDYFCHLMQKSAHLNNCTHNIRILKEDVRKVVKSIPAGSFDAVTVNPPYRKVHSGLINQNYYRAVARHEVLCTLEDVITASAHLLQDRGRLYIIYKPERLAELFAVMQQHKIAPRTLQLVHSDKTHAPYLAMVEGIKNQEGPLRFLPPIFVYDKHGRFTRQIQQYYRFGDE